MDLTEPQQLFVEALRSGEYEQCKQTLRQGNKFCCLGVATDVYHKHTGKGVWKLAAFPSIDGEEYVFGREGETGDVGGFLPDEVVKWLNLDSDNPAIHRSTTATYCNDGTGLSFTEIADLFEEHFKRLNERIPIAN